MEDKQYNDPPRRKRARHTPDTTRVIPSIDAVVDMVTRAAAGAPPRIRIVHSKARSHPTPPNFPTIAAVVDFVTRATRVSNAMASVGQYQEESVPRAWQVHAPDPHPRSNSMITHCYGKAPSVVRVNNVGDLGRIPVSSASHDNAMLCCNRVSSANPMKQAPQCTQGENCAFYSIHNIAPGLHAQGVWLCSYLTPEEEARFQQEGRVDIRRPCLLCIRSDIESIAAASVSRTVEAASHMTPIVPPFANAVDVIGGYKRDMIIDSPVLTGNVVRSTVPLCAGIHPETRRWYVDQSRLIFNSPLN